MCHDTNSCTCGPVHEPLAFDDLEDKDFWNGANDTPSQDELDNAQERQTREVSGGHITSRSTEGRYKCTGCNGTGIITVYRRGGGWGQRGTDKKCWKGCRGTGYTKTSPEARAKNRERVRRRKKMEADRKLERGAQFLLDNPRIAAFFAKHEGNPDWRFPDELKDKLMKYGYLTEGQIGAIEKCIKRDEERQAKWAEQDAAQPETVDLSGMVSGYYAVPGGETRLKVKIDVVTKGKWAGWVFVKDGAEYGGKKRYGSQRPNQQYRGDIIDELRAIAADPMAAMAAYGHLVGRCGMCGRKLEDEKSIARGIGPVCASRL